MKKQRHSFGAFRFTLRPDSHVASPVQSAFLGVLGAALIVAAVIPYSTACNPSFFPPVCGKSTVLVKNSPSVLVNVPGTATTANIPVTVTVAAIASNGGVCPLPVTTDIRITAPCPIGGGLPGTSPVVTIATPVPGTYQANVPVTWPPAPAGNNRRCNIIGTATTNWDDGTTTIGAGDTVVCIVDPAPGTNKPRLDLQLLSPPTLMAHPGDQQKIEYRITNNDPNHSASLSLTADSEQVSNMPGTDAPDAPGSGSGPFAISAPFDHFPIQFVNRGDDICLPLAHPAPGSPPAEDSMALTLAPGEAKIIELATRSWPMCANGSCCEQRLIADGFFSDGSEAFACGGSSYVCDTGIPPLYQCPDSGCVATAKVNQFGGGGVDFYADCPDYNVRLGQYFYCSYTDEEGVNHFPQPGESAVLDTDRSHIRQVNQYNTFIQPGNVLSFSTFIETFSFNEVQSVIESVHVIPPHSGQENNFTLEPKIRLSSPEFNPEFQPFVDGMIQLSVNGRTLSGDVATARIDAETITVEPVEGVGMAITFECVFEEEFADSDIGELMIHADSFMTAVGVQDPFSSDDLSVLGYDFNKSQLFGRLTFRSENGRHYKIQGCNSMGKSDRFAGLLDIVGDGDTTTVFFEDPAMLKSGTRFYRVEENTAPLSDPPCKGATVKLIAAFWDCRNGFWAFVEQTTWICPDGSEVTTEAIVRQTTDPCP